MTRTATDFDQLLAQIRECRKAGASKVWIRALRLAAGPYGPPPRQRSRAAA